MVRAFLLGLVITLDYRISVRHVQLDNKHYHLNTT